MFALLTQAKKDAGEGGWLRWLSENEEVLGFGERQARNYLREPEVRTSGQAKEAKRQKERRAAAKAMKEKPAELSPVPAWAVAMAAKGPRNIPLPSDPSLSVAGGRAVAQAVLKPQAEPPQEIEAVGKSPANKTDFWNIRHETPKERRDVVKVLDKAFEFINDPYVDFEEEIEFLFDDHDQAFESFNQALIAIEMGAMCLTPDHIKALTGWRDRINSILQKTEVEKVAGGDPAVAEP